MLLCLFLFARFPEETPCPRGSAYSAATTLTVGFVRLIILVKS